MNVQPQPIPLVPHEEADGAPDGPPRGFRVGRRGIERLEAASGDEAGRWAWFCSPLRVLALPRGHGGTGWGTPVGVTEPDGGTHRWAVPAELFAGGGRELRAELLRLGLDTAPGTEAENAPHDPLQQWRPRARAITADRLGWTDEACAAFALGDGRVLGDAAVVYQAEVAPAAAAEMRAAGTPEGWRDAAAAPCVGNPLMAAAVSLALAGPPLEPLGLDGAGCTCAARPRAARARGGPGPRRAGGWACCARASGAWRTRWPRRADGGRSSGAAARRGGRHPRPRRLRRPARRPRRGGVRGRLRAATAAQHGTAGPAFVARLIAGREAALAEVRDAMAGFRDLAARHHGCAAEGQTIRAAERLGLIAAAGELATAWGLTGWPAGTAREAALTVLGLWLDGRGGAGPAEAREAVRRTRAFLIQHGAARFEPVGEAAQTAGSGFDREPRPIVSRAGWRDGSAFYVAADAWREVHAGADPARAARRRLAAGLLDPGDGKNLARRLFASLVAERPRACAVRAAILGAGDDGGSDEGQGCRGAVGPVGRLGPRCHRWPLSVRRGAAAVDGPGRRPIPRRGPSRPAAAALRPRRSDPSDAVPAGSDRETAAPAAPPDRSDPSDRLGPRGPPRRRRGAHGRHRARRRAGSGRGRAPGAGGHGLPGDAARAGRKMGGAAVTGRAAEGPGRAPRHAGLSRTALGARVGTGRHAVSSRETKARLPFHAHGVHRAP